MKSVQNGISLKMTIKTRWGSFLKCLKSLLESKYALKSLAVHEEISKILSKCSTSCILDEDILDKNFKNSWFIESYCEMDYNNQHGCWGIFWNQQNLLPSAPLSKNEEKVTLETLKKRKGMTLRTIHYAVNISDPKFKGVNLT